MSHAFAESSSKAFAEREPTHYRWEDFIALDDDDRRELIDGALVEVEVPTEIHEHIVAAIVTSLFTWAHGGGGGRVLASAYKVRISDGRGVMPDVQYYRDPRVAARQQQGLAEGHPDLAVEIISPTSRRYDRVTKLRWYASIGVPEYWVVDPEAHTVERLVLTADGYLIADMAGGDEILRPATFPGLEIPLAVLWDLGEAAEATETEAPKDQE